MLTEQRMATMTPVTTEGAHAHAPIAEQAPSSTLQELAELGIARRGTASLCELIEEVANLHRGPQPILVVCRNSPMETECEL